MRNPLLFFLKYHHKTASVLFVFALMTTAFIVGYVTDDGGEADSLATVLVSGNNTVQTSENVMSTERTLRANASSR